MYVRRVALLDVRRARRDVCARLAPRRLQRTSAVSDAVKEAVKDVAEVQRASSPLTLAETSHGRMRIYMLNSSMNVKKGSLDKKEPVRWLWSDQLSAKQRVLLGVDANGDSTSTAVSASEVAGNNTALDGVQVSEARWYRRMQSSLMASQRGRGLVQTFRATFLPVGYPESVHGAYFRFHIMKFTETTIASALSVLCAQAMLESVGVAASAAAGGAVAILWVLKDGIGEIGKLFFIKRFASQFDARVKTWKLIGEILSVTGSLAALSTVVAPASMFLPLASLGGGMKSIFASLWGATHTTFARIFAVSGNVGDIVAKDEAQLSVAYMAGSAVGLILIYTSHHPAFLFTCWGVLAPMHLYASVNMLRAANFQIPDMTQLRKQEHFFGEWTKPSRALPRVQLGMPLHHLFTSETLLARSIILLKNEHYILGQGGQSTRTERLLIRLSDGVTPSKSSMDSVNYLGTAYSTHATSQDIARSLLHAILLNDSFNSNVFTLNNSQSNIDENHAFDALRESYERCNKEFPRFWQHLIESEWEADTLFFNDRGSRYTHVSG